MIRNLILLLILLSVTVSAHVTNTDSLISEFQKYFGTKKYDRISHNHDEVLKCGTGLRTALKDAVIPKNHPLYNSIQAFLNRPVCQKSVTTPSGFFRVHYDTSGSSIPTYDINEVLSILEHVYDVEVTNLGFPAPPRDLGRGGDDKYDIYITDAGRDYGYTADEEEIVPGSQRYYSYIVINNNFSENSIFSTKGLNAVKVTLAHEFHHAIQMGQYIYRKTNGTRPDLFFFELTSTSMEEIVYTEVNDYYNYIPKFFMAPNVAMTGRDGYEVCIWNLYLIKKFDVSIIKSQWEYLKQNLAMYAIDKSLRDRNSSFAAAYTEFSEWCMFTGTLAIPGKYFDEAGSYPLYEYETVQISSLPWNANFIIYPAGILPIMLTPFRNGVDLDTIRLLVSNYDIDLATNSPSSEYSFPCELQKNSFNNAVSLNNEYYLLAGNMVNTSSRVLYFYYSTPATGITRAVYPNPLRLNKPGHTNVFVPVSSSDHSFDADLTIFDQSLKLVFHDKKAIVSGLISWEPKKENKGYIGTGIYFYNVKTDYSTYTGKIAIINGN
ncbi:MAG: hypothetical protein LWX56_03995 [Ignavibacteria bacterium]|nr:hypothetical protein [Ignavibacteria bacterium]